MKLSASFSLGVLDSPFAAFDRVVEDYCRQRWIPRPFVDFCLSKVCDAAQRRVGCDPRGVRPLQVAPQCHCPALFGAAQEDQVVQARQVQELQAAWGGRKEEKGRAA